MRSLIVIPCFNEANRLDLEACGNFLTKTSDVNLLFVNDGSADGTLELLTDFQARWPERVEVLDQQPNQGKAEAVRRGILKALESKAQYVGYFDADLATPLEAVEEFARTLDLHAGVDLVLGSRVALLGRHIERKASRHYLGRVFATAASLVLGLPVYDTQCGAKLMRAKPAFRQLFAQPFGSRWIFDVELIARYLVGGHSRRSIYELPLHRWTDVGESRVKPRDFVRAVGEMASIYRTYRLPSRWSKLLSLVSAPFLRYIGAGGVGTTAHYATLALVVELSGIAPATATIIGALVGALINYVLNYHFTFASKLPHSRALPRFMAIAALSASMNGLGMWYATRVHSMHYLLAQVLCTLGVLMTGYVLNKAWTFGPDGSRSPARSKKSQGPGVFGTVEAEQSTALESE